MTQEVWIFLRKNKTVLIAIPLRKMHLFDHNFLNFSPASPLSPNVPECLQAIDSGCGWLLMACVFGCLLDKWPLDKIAWACGRMRRVGSKT